MNRRSLWRLPAVRRLGRGPARTSVRTRRGQVLTTKLSTRDTKIVEKLDGEGRQGDREEMAIANPCVQSVRTPHKPARCSLTVR